MKTPSQWRPRVLRTLAGLPLLALTVSGCAAVANEDLETTVLSFSDFLPTSHYAHAQGITPFIERVEEESGGSITFEQYPAAQLVAPHDQTRAAETGLVDVSFFTNNYALEDLPLLSICSLPNAFDTAQEGIAACSSVVETPQVQEALADASLHFMFGFVQQPYTISTAEAEIESVEGLKGLKIQSSGGAYSDTLQTAGVAPVEMAGGEIYESLDRQTIDGTNLNLMSISGYGLEPELRYSYEGIDTGSPFNGFVMNSDSWKGLSADEKEIIDRVGQEVQDELTDWLEVNYDITKQDFKDAGIEFIEFPPEEVAAWEATIAPVWDDWVPNMESRGLDGQPVMDAWNEALEEVRAE